MICSNLLQGRKQVLEFWLLVLLLLLLVKVLIVLLWVLLFCQGVLWLNFETFLLEDLVSWPGHCVLVNLNMGREFW